jgi:hypothetical protein
MPRNLSTAALLAGLLLVVIAMIQVLPQVDLPDTAFHENDAPAVIKSKLLKGPGAAEANLAIAIRIASASLPHVHQTEYFQPGVSRVPLHPISLPFSTLLC